MYGMLVIPCNDFLYRKILKYIKPDCVRAYGGYSEHNIKKSLAFCKKVG
jgi:hypothetical protein